MPTASWMGFASPTAAGRVGLILLARSTRGRYAFPDMANMEGWVGTSKRLSAKKIYPMKKSSKE
jgi:hypothetical protein